MANTISLFLVTVLVILYTCIIPFAVIATDDRRRYTILLLRGLETLLSENEDKPIQAVLPKLVRFYEKYVQANPGAKRYYPSFIFWIDAVMLQINLKRRRVKNISQYQSLLSEAIDLYEKENPHNKCTEYQQNLLQDITELIDDRNRIALTNIIKRTEEEFVRLSVEIKKNDRLNRLSIGIGIFGIVVSVILAIAKF